MKILLYGINYTPELTGIGKYTGEMAAWLAARGHQVEVITAPPYYPAWRVGEDYRGKNWHTETIAGVRVHRCPLYVPSQVSGARRILHEASFLSSSLVWWLPRFFKRYDATIVISPPFHLGFYPLLQRFFTGTPVWNHIQDLQVDAARDLGILQNKSLLRVMFRLEAWLVTRMNRVTSISDGMLQKIEQKGVSPAKLFFLPNWVDSSLVYQLPQEKSLRRDWGFTDTDKIILYAGNLGEKQGLEMIIAAAKRLKTNHHWHFVVVGDGGGKAKLQALAASESLSNVHFYPLQPVEKMASMLATADLHLVLQKRAAADLVMPSKLTNILAAGGLALVTAPENTTLHTIIQRHEMAILVEPESEKALIEAITHGLSGNFEQTRQNALQYANQFLHKDTILTTFEHALLGG